MQAFRAALLIKSNLFGDNEDDRLTAIILAGWQSHWVPVVIEFAVAQHQNNRYGHLLPSCLNAKK
jgi:hypothetical protein